MTFLLDVNVLIALIDPAHVAHDAAHTWFENEGSRDWATCPLTENGVIRIVGSPRYAGGPGSPAAVAQVMERFRRLPGHRFWPDDISLLDATSIDTDRVRTAAQVTDTYLLALAVVHGGKLATFDRRLSDAAVHRGKAALFVIAA